jgi:hypothetical protein
MKIEYIAEPTLAKFHNSDAFYRIVRGPVRSGKSTGMCIEIMNRANKQKPGAGGIRRTRWAIIRNTYRELEDTTLATWKMWFKEDVFGAINQRTMVHTLQFNDVYMEVMFRALDRPDDVAKLLSLELTGAWGNEAREFPRVIVDVLGDRVEQYPPKMDEGCTWGGVMLDTNPPDEDHWMYDAEANPPEGWEFFTQPGALKEVNGKFLPNPKAENIRNLNRGHDYYVKRMAGKKKSYIRVYYCNQFGYVEEGKRVIPEYNDATHCAPSPLVPDPRHPVVIGLDYGLTPAAAFFSHRPNGQWWLFHEIATEDIGIKKFGEMLLVPYVLTTLLDYEFEIFEDPYGNTASQTDKKTPSYILNALGLDIKTPNVESGPNIRREALAAPLSRMIDGEPGMLVDPSCKVIRKGLSSKYIFKRVQVAGDEKYQEKPYKNFWSHVCEAAEHAMVGAGEGKLLISKSSKKKKRPRKRIITSNAWMGG